MYIKVKKKNGHTCPFKNNYFIAIAFLTFSTIFIALRPNSSSNFGAGPAKHLTTFNNHVLEFVSWVSNRSSGAVGLPSYLIYSFWFWKKDVENGFYLKDPEYYRDQSFQEVIYNLNQPYLRITESTFSNFTIMDREYLIEIFGGREYPDGTFVIDYIDEIIEYQKAYQNVHPVP